MSVSYPRPPRRLLITLDLVLVAWVAAWIWIGTEVGRNVDGLGRLSTTLGLAGGALEETGELVERLGDVPFIGGRVEDVAERVRQTGRSARRNARLSRENVEELSVLLGVSIGTIPTVPLLAFYVPLRLAWRRERLLVERALRGGRDPAIDRYLAFRALQNLPYDRLRLVSEDPWTDIQEGRAGRLAEAELERLGLRQPGRGERDEP